MATRSRLPQRLLSSHTPRTGTIHPDTSTKYSSSFTAPYLDCCCSGACSSVQLLLNLLARCPPRLMSTEQDKPNFPVQPRRISRPAATSGARGNSHGPIGRLTVAGFEVVYLIVTKKRLMTSSFKTWEGVGGSRGGKVRFSMSMLLEVVIASRASRCRDGTRRLSISDQVPGRGELGKKK